jgi:homoserine kinase
MPASIALVERLRERGHAAVVSGAGPSVLVLHGGAGTAATTNERLSEITEITRAAAADGPTWRQLELAVGRGVELIG